MRRTLAALLSALAAAALTAGPRAGAETALDKYQSLLQEKRALMRENALLQQEAEIAATKSPYIFFHLADGKLEFRVRGKAFKSYAFGALSLDERGRRPATAEMLFRALDKPLTVEEVQGAHPELIPPDPNTAKQDGQLFSDPNQLAAQTGTAGAAAAGAGLVRTDAGVLGVDVPTDYYIRFQENVVFHIRTPKPQTFREKAADRLAEIARNMRATLSGLWGAREVETADKPRLELFMTTDADTAKNLHYSLLPGERIIAVPPPPPPIVLVASTRGGRAAGEASPAAR